MFFQPQVLPELADKFFWNWWEKIGSKFLAKTPKGAGNC
jgi:hypothetical protein